MTNHTITFEGKRYYTAQVVDSYTGETYDQTAIFVEDEHDMDAPPKFVDYYYGSPDMVETAKLVWDYHTNLVKCGESALERFCKRLAHLAYSSIQPMTIADILHLELINEGVSPDVADEFSEVFAALKNNARRTFGSGIQPEK